MHAEALCENVQNLLQNCESEMTRCFVNSAHFKQPKKAVEEKVENAICCCMTIGQIIEEKVCLFLFSYSSVVGLLARHKTQSNPSDGRSKRVGQGFLQKTSGCHFKMRIDCYEVPLACVRNTGRRMVRYWTQGPSNIPEVRTIE